MKQGTYSSFMPSSLKNIQLDFSGTKIPKLLENALIELGELNAYSELMPDINFFVKMHIAKEASSSSRIEGTKTEIDELFISEDVIAEEKRDDRQEVLNYIEAMNWTIKELGNLPLSMRLIKGTHKILLSGTRGKHKLPGEIRKSQNWIGGSSINSAFFIPPAPQDLGDLLTDLEYFWHEENNEISHLLKAGISHYQFETIHPFLDGNGRTGRLLIILYLINYGLLKKPSLYLSSYFDNYRQEYYDALTYVRTQNNLEHWLLFFLEGVQVTAKDSKNVFKKVSGLKLNCEKKITQELGRRTKLGLSLLQNLFSKPIFSVEETSKALNITFPTANSLLKEFERIQILREKTGSERNRLYEFQEYLNLFS